MATVKILSLGSRHLGTAFRKIVKNVASRCFLGTKYATKAFAVAAPNYGTFAPKNFRSRERKYHGMELSLPGTFVPGSESSENFRSLELSLPRQVTFVRDIRSWICMHTRSRQSF